MTDRFLLKIAAPTIAISLMLLGLGAVAAWHVHRQQSIHSTVIVRDVDAMLAAHDLYAGMRDVRHRLNQFLRTSDQHYFDKIPELHERTQARLEKATALAHTDQERALIALVDRGYQQFWSKFDRINQPDFDGDRPREFARLLDEVLPDEILGPGEQFIAVNREVIERTNEASRATAKQLRQGFLLLGVCGGAGGLIAGLGIARAISRSIVQLEVSVRSAAGKLHPLAGPVRISRVGGFQELETGLARIEDHISELVQRLQRTELEVLRNDQLAAVGQLAASVAHEFRNPLMPMKMLVQLALERDDGRGLYGRPLEVVDEEIVRLERSIQSFLEFARPAPLEKSTFDVIPVVEQTLELVAPRAQNQNVRILEQLPESPVTIAADCAQIRQVLLNLLLNALDAMPGGGQVAVGVRQLGDHDVSDPFHLNLRAEIRIADSGSGLDPAVLDRVFEPFVTTKETGSGLGLTVCQRIVVAHAGEITAQNNSHGGAEFIIRLPCLSAADPFRTDASMNTIREIT